MPKVIEKTVYLFNELNDYAKKVAINKERELIDFNCDFVIDDCKYIAELLGINDSVIRFTGFCSQGDGASFTGSYKYAKDANKTIVEHAPKDEQLIAIANRLTAVQERAKFEIECDIDYSDSRYCHSNTMQFSYKDYESNSIEPAIIRDECSSILRAFADWIYIQLNNEYDYQHSDAQIIESLEANEVWFYDNGKVAQ